MINSELNTEMIIFSLPNRWSDRLIGEEKQTVHHLQYSIFLNQSSHVQIVRESDVTPVPQIHGADYQKLICTHSNSKDIGDEGSIGPWNKHFIQL